jgi:HNH endonuclease
MSPFWNPPKKCTCAQCGKEFERWPSKIALAKSGLQFCSNACRGAHKSAQFGGHDSTCHHCGKIFRRPPSGDGKDRSFCSRACYDASRQNDVDTRNRPVGRCGKNPVQCQHCGKTFYVKTSVLSSRTNLYCSRACKRLGSVTTGSHIPKEYIRRTQPRQCTVCGIDDSDVLEIHHKDRNRKNNKLENLIVLCANCHTKIHRGLLALE